MNVNEFDSGELHASIVTCFPNAPFTIWENLWRISSIPAREQKNHLTTSHLLNERGGDMQFLNVCNVGGKATICMQVD